MKKFIQKIIILIVAITFSSNLNVKAMNTIDFFYNSKVVDYSVVINWDKERPDVNLISPSGEIIDVFRDSETYVSETFAIYDLIQTEIGQWQISCDKKSNEFVDITYTEQNDGVWIEDFIITEFTETSANVFFKVDKEVSYTYEISAILENDTSSKKVLKTGNSSKLEVTDTVNLSDLNSYNGYKLMLVVKLANTELIIEDTAVSESFNYTNPNEAEAPAIENIGISINLEDCMVLIDTSENYRNNEILLRYETDVTTEKTEVFTQNTSFIYDYTASKLTLGLRAEDRSKYSEELIKEIDFDSCVSYDWIHKDEYVINTLKTSVYINNAKGYDIIATTNGISNHMKVENDIININLIDGNNEFELVIIDSDGIKWVFSESIYVDTSSPNFRVFEDYNNKIVDKDSIIIVGEVEMGSVLTLNDVAVEIDSAGGFLVEVPLVLGENILSFVATDVAQNKISYSPVITYQKEALSDLEKNEGYKYLILSGGFLISSILCITTIIIVKKKGNE